MKIYTGTYTTDHETNSGYLESATRNGSHYCLKIQTGNVQKNFAVWVGAGELISFLRQARKDIVLACASRSDASTRRLMGADGWITKDRFHASYIIDSGTHTNASLAVGNGQCVLVNRDAIPVGMTRVDTFTIDC